MYLDGLVRLLTLLNIYNRDPRVEVDSDERREEIDVWDVKRREAEEEKIRDLKMMRL
jgi:hypothetical protein